MHVPKLGREGPQGLGNPPLNFGARPPKFPTSASPNFMKSGQICTLEPQPCKILDIGCQIWIPRARFAWGGPSQARQPGCTAPSRCCRVWFWGAAQVLHPALGGRHSGAPLACYEAEPGMADAWSGLPRSHLWLGRLLGPWAGPRLALWQHCQSRRPSPGQGTWEAVSGPRAALMQPWIAWAQLPMSKTKDPCTNSAESAKQSHWGPRVTLVLGSHKITLKL